MGKTRVTALMVSLSLAILLPLIGNRIRQSAEPGCALDGQSIDPALRVRIRDQDQHAYEFCCIRCAEFWLARHDGESLQIDVTDEPTGQEIPAATAFFVRSLVVNMKATGNRVHVFKNKSAAENHARLFRGTVLGNAERPFSNDR